MPISQHSGTKVNTHNIQGTEFVVHSFRWWTAAGLVLPWLALEHQVWALGLESQEMRKHPGESRELTGGEAEVMWGLGNSQGDPGGWRNPEAK